jgi:hypothetical protein
MHCPDQKADFYSSNSMLADFLFRPDQTVADVRNAVNPGVPVEGQRLISLFEGVDDEIWRTDVPLSTFEPVNPLVVEITPEDQISFLPSERLAAVAHHVESQGAQKIVKRSWLRLAPYERFGEVRARLKEEFRDDKEGKRVEFYLNTRGLKRLGKSIVDDLVIWDELDEMFSVKAVVKSYSATE